MNNKYAVDQRGYYGAYGGAFIPEMLRPNIDELRENYLKIIESDQFQKDFKRLLQDYVGRPSPLYYASRLPETGRFESYRGSQD